MATEPKEPSTCPVTSATRAPPLLRPDGSATSLSRWSWSGNCGQYLNAPGPEVLIDDLIYLMVRKEIPAGGTVSFELAYSLSSQDFAAAVLAVLEANMTVSDAPTEVSGVAGDGQVTVSWTAPASDGRSPITGYTVTASPGGASCTVDAPAPATSCVVSGLTNGTAYTFTVVATNGVGDSQPSAASAAVTPVAPPATTPPVRAGTVRAAARRARVGRRCGAGGPEAGHGRLIRQHRASCEGAPAGAPSAFAGFERVGSGEASPEERVGSVEDRWPEC